MKVIIAGKNNIAVNILDELLKKEKKESIFVILNKNDNGIDSWQRSLKKYAYDKNLKIISLEEAYQMKEIIFLSLEFDRIIDIKKFQKDAKLYNIHFSKLPKYKGMYTSAHPILNNEKETGVTLHKIDNGIDTGDIIDQISFKISFLDTARSLYLKYINFGTKLILDRLDDLLTGKINSYKQDLKESTYYSKKSIDYTNLKIDLNQTAQNIYNQIRAFNFREFQLPMIKKSEIISSRITNIRSQNKPGTVLFENESMILTSTVDYNIVFYKDRTEKLFDACKNNDLTLIKEICIVKEHINVQNEYGWTPLIVCTYNGYIEAVEFLIGIGADITLKNYNGTNVLMYAKEAYIKTKKRNLLDFFLELGCSLEEKDYKGKNLLDYINIENIDWEC